jgi:DNA polymerase III subunit delta
LKLTGSRLTAFLRKPDPFVVAVLIYGPDQGLVRERADLLSVAVAGSGSDPFRVAELTGDLLKDDRARLSDEAAALPFSGGRRVVRVRDGKDALTGAVRLLLEAGDVGGLVVVEAGELSPRSTLRQTFEAAERGAAIACYLDDAETLQRVIVEELGRQRISASREAVELLAAVLGADRGVTRSELEKLALYRGSPGRVEVADVLAVISDAGAVSIDAIVLAACDGDVRSVESGLPVAAGEGVSAISLLRAMARHLERLVQARAAMAGGRDAAQAMAAVRPRVFFRVQAQFQRQIELWTPDRLAAALGVVGDAELACKSTGAPQDMLCHRAFAQVAALVRGSRRRG